MKAPTTLIVGVDVFNAGIGVGVGEINKTKAN